MATTHQRASADNRISISRLTLPLDPSRCGCQSRARFSFWFVSDTTRTLLLHSTHTFCGGKSYMFICIVLCTLSIYYMKGNQMESRSLAGRWQKVSDTLIGHPPTRRSTVSVYIRFTVMWIYTSSSSRFLLFLRCLTVPKDSCLLDIPVLYLLSSIWILFSFAFNKKIQKMYLHSRFSSDAIAVTSFLRVDQARRRSVPVRIMKCKVGSTSIVRQANIYKKEREVFGFLKRPPMYSRPGRYSLHNVSTSS